MNKNNSTVKTIGLDLSNSYSLLLKIIKKDDFLTYNIFEILPLHEHTDFLAIGTIDNIPDFWRFFNNIDHFKLDLYNNISDCNISDLENLVLFLKLTNNNIEHLYCENTSYHILLPNLSNYISIFTELGMLLVGNTYNCKYFSIDSVVLSVEKKSNNESNNNFIYDIIISTSSRNKSIYNNQLLWELIIQLYNNNPSISQEIDQNDIQVKMGNNTYWTPFEEIKYNSDIVKNDIFVEKSLKESVNSEFNYSREFLFKFSNSSSCQKFPAEFSNFNWDLLIESFKPKPISAFNEINKRRDSWPNSNIKAKAPNTKPFHNLKKFPGSLSLTNIASFDAPSYSIFGENVEKTLRNMKLTSKTDSFSLQQKSHPKSLLPSIKTVDEWKEDNINISNKKMLIKSALADYQDYFTISLDTINANISNILATEGCPKCLTGAENQLGTPIVVLLCRVLNCQHCVHVSCLLNQLHNVPTLYKFHNTTTFKSILNESNTRSITRFNDKLSQKTFNIQIELTHLLSNAQILRLDWSEIPGFLDVTTNQEYIVKETDTSSIQKPFSIRRGRIIFHCTCLSTNQKILIDANYDINETDSTNSCKLVYRDSLLRSTLSIHVQRKDNDKNTFYIQSISLEIGHPLSLHPTEKQNEIAPSIGLSVIEDDENNYIYKDKKVSSKVLSNQINSHVATDNRPFSPPVPEYPNIENSFSSFNQIDHVIGRVYNLARSQGGSRFVQQKLDENDSRYFEIFFTELKEHVADLMMDSFGHYTIEKLIRICSNNQLGELLQHLFPRIIEVACHKQGSFSLQAMMESIKVSDQIEQLASNINENVVTLMMNSSGHFVLLRFLQQFSIPHTRFIIQAAQKNCLKVSSDHYGLRVMKAILDIGPQSELNDLYKTLSRLTMKLAEHQYGNYLIQHILENSPRNIRASIQVKMEGKFVRLAKQKFSSNVVEKCLRSNSNEELKDVIIRELSNAAADLIKDRYGNYVLQTTVLVCNGAQLKEFVYIISPALNGLRDNVRAKWENILYQASNRTGTIIDIPNLKLSYSSISPFPSNTTPVNMGQNNDSRNTNSTSSKTFIKGKRFNNGDNQPA